MRISKLPVNTDTKFIIRYCTFNYTGDKFISLSSVFSICCKKKKGHIICKREREREGERERRLIMPGVRLTGLNRSLTTRNKFYSSAEGGGGRSPWPQYPRLTMTVPVVGMMLLLTVITVTTMAMTTVKITMMMKPVRRMTTMVNTADL